MNKWIRKVLVLAAFWSSSKAIFAQSEHGRIEAPLHNYSENSVNEKLFVHTDKNFYLAGEIIWFKLYYVDGVKFAPLDLSKVAYIEMLDRDLKPVLQSKIALSEGSGNGSLYLPASLTSGVYHFRAYTQWMRNSGADNFFEKQITIVNSTKNLEPQPRQNTGFDIGFFPEGGNLVQNLQSKLAFRIVDTTGKGVNSKGIVVNQNHDTVATFQTLKFGIGQFLFTPRAGDSYKAIISIYDSTVTRELPLAHVQGYVMNVSKEGEGKLHIRVSSNIQADNSIRLVVHSRQGIKLSEQKTINTGTAEFVIDQTKLAEGISYFTIFNGANQPLCERLYFVPPAKRLLLESSAGQQFAGRSRVDISILSKDETGNPVAADLSIAVYKTDTGASFEGIDITSYFWLVSELRGHIELPGFYFSEKNPQVEEAADNLMLTHGWRKFRSQHDTTRVSLANSFIPELKGHIIQAKITNTKTGLPAPDMITYLSVPGKRVQMYSAKSDSSGKVKFYTNNFFGRNEILVQTQSSENTSYSIEIINPFSEKYSSPSPSSFVLPEKMKQPLKDQHVNLQVQNVFSGDKLKQFFSPVVDSNAFYGAPDNLYMLDDYIRFSTMEEVLREYVSEVLVRRQKEDFRLMISGGLENRIFMDDPLTLFNGVPVFETNKIMQFDPLKVQKIEVVKRRYFYGSSTFNGIVNFTTYQPDPVMLSSLNAVVFDYEGLQIQREFYSPIYETPEQLTSRMPDFRNVLYWSPGIKTGPAGKTDFNFYTSDQQGKYIVVVQGMNANGKTGQHFFTFNVK